MNQAVRPVPSVLIPLKRRAIGFGPVVVEGPEQVPLGAVALLQALEPRLRVDLLGPHEQRRRRGLPLNAATPLESRFGVITVADVLAVLLRLAASRTSGGHGLLRRVIASPAAVAGNC